jgi:hypothetical protein
LHIRAERAPSPRTVLVWVSSCLYPLQLCRAHFHTGCTGLEASQTRPGNQVAEIQSQWWLGCNHSSCPRGNLAVTREGRESDISCHLTSLPELWVHILVPWETPTLTEASSTWVRTILVPDSLFQETDSWWESRQVKRTDSCCREEVGLLLCHVQLEPPQGLSSSDHLLFSVLG